MLTTFHFAFHRKFIEDLYAQVSGIFEQARVHAGVGFDSCTALAAGFAGFCASTETPIRGAGNDAISSHGIWLNAKRPLWRRVMTFHRIRLAVPLPGAISSSLCARVRLL
jgi:hypothetical protein